MVFETLKKDDNHNSKHIHFNWISPLLISSLVSAFFNCFVRCKKDVGQVENIAECHFSDYKTNTNREKGEKKRRELAAAHVKHLLYNKYFR